MLGPKDVILSIKSPAALALAGFAASAGPVVAQQTGDSRGSAEDLGVMQVSLQDAVKYNWGFQAQTQGAGTPNAIGIGTFLPISVGENSVFFLDTLANVNLSDIGNSSSIINTEISGTTISTSTRLGYRWLNQDRSWMFGLNTGYDSRPMATGQADSVDKHLKGSRTAFFQQVAAGAEAVNKYWNFNAYALVPIGDTEQRLNQYFNGGALDTFGLDIGYNIAPDLRATIGYYYQNGDQGCGAFSDRNSADGSGVLGRIDYEISNGLSIGANLSYDDAYLARFSADVKYRFGGTSKASETEKKSWEQPTIKALSETVRHRDVRVHDKSNSNCDFFCTGTAIQNCGDC